MSDDLKDRAKAWMKANDGGHLGVWWPAGSKPGDNSSPILAIMWDGGGTGEIRDKHGTALADLQHPTKRRNNTPIGPRSSNNGWSKPA